MILWAACPAGEAWGFGGEAPESVTKQEDRPGGDDGDPPVWPEGVGSHPRFWPAPTTGTDAGDAKRAGQVPGVIALGKAIPEERRHRAVRTRSRPGTGLPAPRNDLGRGLLRLRIAGSVPE